MTKQYDLTLDAERRLLRAAHIAPAAKAQSLQSYFESQGVTFLPGCDAVLNSQKHRLTVINQVQDIEIVDLVFKSLLHCQIKKAEQDGAREPSTARLFRGETNYD